MGYTHYWSQPKDFTREEWKIIKEDVSALLSHAQNERNIPLADGVGHPGTQPEIDDDKIYFNGVGENGHETFCLYRKRLPKEPYQRVRGSDFCKTARKPYDEVVGAVLCYLATVPEKKTFHVTSDGHGHEWLKGLGFAKEALPKYDNVLDIPMGIMEEDCWIGPWGHYLTDRYRFNFCVDGYAYIREFNKSSRMVASYRFNSHAEGAAFFHKNKAVLDPTGFFDEARNRQLKQAQEYLLSSFFLSGILHADGHDTPPPAFVRPNEYPKYGERCSRWVDVDNMIAELTGRV